MVFFGHVMRKADSLEKTLMLGKVDGKRRRGLWLIHVDVSQKTTKFCKVIILQLKNKLIKKKKKEEKWATEDKTVGWHP